MIEEQGIGPSLYQTAMIHYPLNFASAVPTAEGLLLKGESHGYFHLKRFSGELQDLQAALDAEEYLRRHGLGWVMPSIQVSAGERNMEAQGQNYYLKEWQPAEIELPFRFKVQFGSEILAWVHQMGEGFTPRKPEGWEWPDWLKLFEMARDSIYELHTSVVKSDKEELARHFDRTAREALRCMEEAIVHLKSAGYHEQRAEGMRKGFVSLKRIPSPALGCKFDLIDRLIPDLPACGLGAFLGQMGGDWSKISMINDVLELVQIYNQIRKLQSEEIDLIKGFLKFPWQFWWATEEYFAKDEKKKHKTYAKALQNTFDGYSKEIRLALQEF